MVGFRCGQDVKVFVFWVVALAAPCITAEDFGRIFVYAQRLTPARSWISISYGGAAAADVKRGMFFAINAAPGRSVLSLEEGVPAFVEVHSGEDAFVRLDWHFEAGRPPIAVLSVVRPDQARKEMKFLSYIDAKRVRSTAVAKTDPREPPQLQLKRRQEK